MMDLIGKEQNLAKQIILQPTFGLMSKKPNLIKLLPLDIVMKMSMPLFPDSVTQKIFPG